MPDKRFYRVRHAVFHGIHGGIIPLLQKREDLLSRLLSPQMQHGRHGAAVGRVRQLVLVAFQLVLHAVIGRVRPFR